MTAGGSVLAGGTTPPRTAVLHADADLRAVLPHEHVMTAAAASVALVRRLETGDWDARPESGRAAGGYGLLVLSGVLLRRVGVEGRYGGELLARGDLLRPWQHDGEPETLLFETTWKVISPVSLAVLDERWVHRMAPYPQLGVELVRRTLERARRLAINMSLVQQPVLERRLWLVLWDVADRFGVVHPDGVHIDLPLTHDMLAHLAAARRPSVSAALSRMTARRMVSRQDRNWVLHGEAPVLADELLIA